MAIPMDSEKHKLLLFFMDDITPKYRDPTAPDDWERAMTRSRSLNVRPCLLLVLTVAKLGFDSLVLHDSFRAGYKSVQSSRSFLVYKQAALDSIAKELCLVSETDALAAIYAVDLLVVLESICGNHKTVVSHLKGFRQFLTTRNLWPRLPFYFHKDFCTISNKVATSTEGRPEFPPPTLRGVPSALFQRSLATHTAFQGHPRLMFGEAEDGSTYLPTELRQIWKNLRLLSDFSELRQLDPRLIDGEDVRYFRAIELNLEYQLLSQVYVAKTEPGAWGDLYEACLYASLLFMNFALFYTWADSPVTLNPLRRLLQLSIIISENRSMTQNETEMFLWTCYVSALCSRGRPKMYRKFVELISLSSTNNQWSNWPAMSLVFWRYFCIRCCMADAFMEIYNEAHGQAKVETMTPEQLMVGHNPQRQLPGGEERGWWIMGKVTETTETENLF